jgi:S1/P1 Nuclease
MVWPSIGWAWGQEGHSIIAEIAQRRLSPKATAEIARLLGLNHSLASISNWADDERDVRPETYRWHFVDIPIVETHYDPAKHCATESGGDCIVAELERLRNELRCAPTDNQKRDALKFTVHFVGDLHQPLHTVDDARGGNDIPVEVKLRGALKCREGPCPMLTQRSNFHRVWDTNLIQRTTWNWGGYVDGLEDGWLRSAEAQGADGGTIIEWAEATHSAAQTVWNRLPASRVLDDAYYEAVLPVLDRQLGLAGLRLAKFLNTAYGDGACPKP